MALEVQEEDNNFFGGWKPLSCFIWSEAHMAIDCPQNPKRANGDMRRRKRRTHDRRSGSRVR